MQKIRNYFILCLISCLSLAGATAYAQKTSARATVKPADIMIGEQAVIDLEVIAPKGRDILLPTYPDTLISGIEVLRMLAPDTTIAHEVMTIHQRYIITSFDSLLYFVPYLTVIDGSDTVRTNSFGLKVMSPMLSDSTLTYLEMMNTNQTDSIDFEMLGIADIKANLDPPFVWQDLLEYLWIALIILLVLLVIGLGLYFGLRKKKKGYFFKPEVVLPPHVIALKALDKVKSEKIWQQGREKQFYTELTDILREYIEKRFMFNTFERTSDQILETMNIFAEADSSIESLTQILKLSDLVKFAKYKPLQNENDLSMVNAYLFVNQTKVEVPAPVSENGESGGINFHPDEPATDNPAEFKTEEDKANK